MKIKVFSVYDEKAQAYMQPFQMLHTGQAERTFGDCINSPKHQFSHHPHDYTLFEIGEFDDSSGNTTNSHIPLGNGVEFISAKKIELIQDIDEHEATKPESSPLQSGSQS